MLIRAIAVILRVILMILSLTDNSFGQVLPLSPIPLRTKCVKCSSPMNTRGWQFCIGHNERGQVDREALGWWMYIGNCSNASCDTSGAMRRVRAAITFTEYRALPIEQKALGPQANIPGKSRTLIIGECCDPCDSQQTPSQSSSFSPSPLSSQGMMPHNESRRLILPTPGPLFPGRPAVTPDFFNRPSGPAIVVPDGSGMFHFPSAEDSLKTVGLHVGVTVAFIGGVSLGGMFMVTQGMYSLIQPALPLGATAGSKWVLVPNLLGVWVLLKPAPALRLPN